MTEEELSQAILAGELKAVQSYIKGNDQFHALTLEAPNGYEYNPLKLSAIAEVHHQGASEVTRFICLHSPEELQAETLISFASEDKYVPEARVLLQGGLPVDGKYQDENALQRATGNSNLKMVHLLLSYGADPKANGKYGTALENAQKNYAQPAFFGMMEAAMNGVIKPPFEFIDLQKVKKQLEEWTADLQSFISRYPEENFYCIALDAGRLKANSEEAFLKTLNSYQEMFPGKYDRKDKISNLKYNVGDFSYRVADEGLRKPDDAVLADRILEFSFLERRDNEDRIEKELLLDGLIQNQEVMLEGMKRTEDFRIKAPGHIY